MGKARKQPQQNNNKDGVDDRTSWGLSVLGIIAQVNTHHLILIPAWETEIPL